MTCEIEVYVLSYQKSGDCNTTIVLLAFSISKHTTPLTTHLVVVLGLIVAAPGIYLSLRWVGCWVGCR